jgi:hypothetical protein
MQIWTVRKIFLAHAEARRAPKINLTELDGEDTDNKLLEGLL